MRALDGMAPRSRARLCVVINQLAFPGLGTLLMGRRVGYAQAALMIVGFFLVTGFLVWYLVSFIRYVGSSTWDEETFRKHYLPCQWALYYGLAFCVVAWIWSLFSSITILRESFLP
jgi:hypothetical protein